MDIWYVIYEYMYLPTMVFLGDFFFNVKWTNTVLCDYMITRLGGDYILLGRVGGAVRGRMKECLS